jgi:cardiolipin synthase
MRKVSTWKFVTTSDVAWEAMLASCRKAEKSIDIEQFAFGNSGKIFEDFMAVLKEKAKSGVRVRLLLDAIGSFGLYTSFVRRELHESGIEIVFHRTIIPPSLKRVVPFIARDHRKLLIVDEKEAHIGGVIIEERARTWRDTNVIVTGTILDDCLLFFHTAWSRAEHMKPIGKVLSSEGKGEFYLAGNSFHLRDKQLYSIIVRNAATAKNTIYITTPYFALTRDMRRALWFAKQRGVDICFLLPRRSDNLLSDIIGRFFYTDLLRKGIKIFHYTKSILHAKAITIDGAWATIGSCNLDWLSIWLNYELNLVSENADFALELENIFLEDIKESQEVTLSTPKWYGFFNTV